VKSVRSTQYAIRSNPFHFQIEKKVLISLLPLGVLASLAGLVLMAMWGESAVVRRLWLASMALVVASQLHGSAWIRVRTIELRISAHQVALATILLAALLLRVWRLGEIPQEVHGDFASIGLQASAWVHGPDRAIFKFGWADIPMLAYVPGALGMAWLGESLSGLAIASALMGSVSVLGLYLLASYLFGRRVGLMAAALLAVSYTHIHFSRLAVVADPLPWELFALYFLVRGLQEGSGLAMALAGICMGVGVQGYGSSRIILVVVGLLLLHLSLPRRRGLRARWRGLLIFVIAFGVAIAPLALYAIDHWSALLGRFRIVSLLSNPKVMAHLQGKYHTDSVAAVWAEQVKRTFLTFYVYGDTSPHFGFAGPIVDGVTASLMVLGLAYSLWRVYVPRYFLMPAWMFSTLILGGVITNDPPYWTHLLPVLPPTAAMAAVALDAIWGQLAALDGRWLDRVLNVAVVALLLVVGWHNWRVYYRTVRENGSPRSRIARYVNTLPAWYRVQFVSDPYSWGDREFQFLNGDRVGQDIPAQVLREEKTPISGDVVFILTANHRDLLPILQARYPQGEVQEEQLSNGRTAFIAYLVSASSEAGEEGAPIVLPSAPAALPAGARLFIGDTSSRTWEIPLGDVQVKGEKLVVQVMAVLGHDAVYDYLRVVDDQRNEWRFEAEDTRYTTGDRYSDRHVPDGHWWLQRFDPFSNHQGLVALKSEHVPPLTTRVTLPNGHYRLFLGSFTGDPANGPFAVAVRVGESAINE